MFVSCASDAMSDVSLFASSDGRDDVSTVNIFDASVVVFESHPAKTETKGKYTAPHMTHTNAENMWWIGG